MPLQEEFNRSGSWLFRWRSFFPLLLIFLFLGSLVDGDPQTLLRTEFLRAVISLAVSFFGLGIRAYTIGHTPAKTSGRNTRKQLAEKLNTSGIYSLSRHPLYIGNFFMYLGLMLFTGHIWAVLLFILLFVIYYERIMFTEESFLREKFGKEYLDWASRTPVFPYRFKQFTPPDLSFSLRHVLRREYSGFYAVIISLLVFKALGDLILLNRINANMFWIILSSAGTLIWAVLRILSKYTKLLKVSGR
ncbi:MAG TPA: isoprenylcysteine carboxylmethyltransferase family protein [Candidatus Cloacimonadota bacterium]|nr:isoprenylcysteine carboxylmethyltransferase family protein [Candidatus Cloacimonadota bacterium]